MIGGRARHRTGLVACNLGGLFGEVACMHGEVVGHEGTLLHHMLERTQTGQFEGRHRPYQRMVPAFPQCGMVEGPTFGGGGSHRFHRRGESIQWRRSPAACGRTSSHPTMLRKGRGRRKRERRRHTHVWRRRRRRRSRGHTRRHDTPSCSCTQGRQVPDDIVDITTWDMVAVGMQVWEQVVLARQGPRRGSESGIVEIVTKESMVTNSVVGGRPTWILLEVLPGRIRLHTKTVRNGLGKEIWSQPPLLLMNGTHLPDEVHEQRACLLFSIVQLLACKGKWS